MVCVNLAETVNSLQDKDFFALYGAWSPLDPAGVAALFDGSAVRCWVVGGRAPRAGAPPPQPEDTDVAFRYADLPVLQHHLRDWHLWETHQGTLRPLLPGFDLLPDREQLWLRRDARHPWVLDLLVQRNDDEWVFKKDARVRLPWDRALHRVDGIWYLRPEIALLHKAHINRPKDRADLSAAVLTPDARAWLAEALDLLGYAEWAGVVRAPTG